MVEILWSSQAPHLPTNDQEFFELRLVDLGASIAPRYVVREIRGSWSASAQQIRWNGFKDQSCRTPEEAKRRFDCGCGISVCNPGGMTEQPGGRTAFRFSRR